MYKGELVLLWFDIGQVKSELEWFRSAYSSGALGDLIFSYGKTYKIPRPRNKK